MQELNSTVAELSSGRQVLLDCRITRIRSAEADGSWTATYELDVRDGATNEQSTWALHGDLTPPGSPLPEPALPESTGVAFGAQGWSVSLDDLRLHLQMLDPGDALPGLTLLLDPARATSYLDGLLAGAARHAPGLPLTACVAVVVDHKPGVRAAVLCNLEYTHPERVDVPHAVVIKVHDDDSGALAQSAMESLFTAGLGSGPILGLAEPLAYDADLGVSVQQFVEHDTDLKELIHRAFEEPSPEATGHLAQAMVASGAALAALHGSGVTPGEPVTFDDEFGTVRRKYAKLAAAVPTLEGLLGPAIARVEEAATAAPPDPLVPAHHSLRPAQVLVNHGGIAIIDFDKVCRAEAASDIASLTTKLLHMAMNKVEGDASASEREDTSIALRTAFLDEYRRAGTVSDERLALWEALELISLELSAVKKMDHTRMESCHVMIEHHLAAYGV